jgi:hypothetical protein
MLNLKKEQFKIIIPKKLIIYLKDNVSLKNSLLKKISSYITNHLFKSMGYIIIPILKNLEQEVCS